MAMLMSMIIGTLTVSAQSAGRGSSEQKRTTSTSKTYKNPTHKSNSTAVRKTQSDRHVTSTNPSSHAQRGETVQTNRINTSKNGNSVRATQRTSSPNAISHRSGSSGMSISNRTNPKSDYRTANKTVHIGKTYADPKHSNRQSTHEPGTKHYKETHFTRNSSVPYRKYYYPDRKVKIHVHPLTYRDNYRVLYYPRYSEIIWTRSMYRRYADIYPHYTGWHYSWGYRIQTMSVFDARYNVGEIARVYGRVYATWYNKETDDLLLFFGGEYPYQSFTMLVPGKVARRYSWRPERYFLGQHVAATGLITMFEGKAEMMLKKKSQLSVY